MKPVAPKSRLVVDGLGVASTDVVMNLFIFFLIAFALLATFDRKKQVEAQERQAQARQAEQQRKEHLADLELPLSSATQGEAGPGALTVECTRDGLIRLEGQPVERAALTGALAKAMAGQQRPIVLRAHKGLELGEAVAVLDLIRAAGPSTVSIATVEK